MKKNRVMRFASALMALTLLSACFISGTYAKYTSTAKGASTATVAKWSFKAMGSEIAVTGDAPTLAFDLFNTVNDTGNTAAEADVAGTKVVAPGTAGSFEMKVENDAAVKTRYTIRLEEINNNNIPLQYSLDGINWVDSVAELTVTGLTDRVLGIGAAETGHKVYWRWVFEGSTSGAHASQTDASDTALGIAAQTSPAEVTIKATVTATQVD